MGSGSDWVRVCLSAVGSSADERRRLEKHLRAHPDDLETRVRLVGCHWLKATKDAFRRRARHLLWIAAHHPSVNLGGFAHLPSSEVPKESRRVRDAWLDAVARHDSDASIANAAASFIAFEEPGRAVALYTRIAASDPSSSSRQHVGVTYRKLARRARGARLRQKHARAAVEWFRAALQGVTESWHIAMLQLDIAESAVLARDWAIATAAAQRALAKKNASTGVWVHGNIIHDAHATLGLADVARGNLMSAVRHLRAAGRSPGSPQLNSFGPDMALANKLLRHAPKDVIAYLRDVRRFWKGHDALIDEWIDAIARGEKPTLGRR